MQNAFKYLKEMFHRWLTEFGEVHLAVRYSDNTKLGTRGFTTAEKEKGIILYFDKSNHAHLTWSATGDLQVVLSFGSQQENCFICRSDIVGVYTITGGLSVQRLAEEGPPQEVCKNVVRMTDYIARRKK